MAVIALELYKFIVEIVNRIQFHIDVHVHNDVAVIAAGSITTMVIIDIIAIIALDCSNDRCNHGYQHR